RVLDREYVERVVHGNDDESAQLAVSAVANVVAEVHDLGAVGRVRRGGRERRSLDGSRHVAALDPRPADLARDVGVAGKVGGVGGEGGGGGPCGRKRDVEVGGGVGGGGLPADHEARLGDVGAMDDVVADLDLAEHRVALHDPGAHHVEDVPVVRVGV